MNVRVKEIRVAANIIVRAFSAIDANEGRQGYLATKGLATEQRPCHIFLTRTTCLLGDLAADITLTALILFHIMLQHLIAKVNGAAARTASSYDARRKIVAWGVQHVGFPLPGSDASTVVFVLIRVNGASIKEAHG